MSRKHWLILTFIFALPLVIGISYLKWGYIPPVTGDSVTAYEPIALSLVEGKGFTVIKNGEFLMPRVAPGYPIFLALIYKIFGHNYSVARIIQFILLGGISSLIYLIGRRHLKLSSLSAFLSSLIVVFWPYFILYSTLILTEVLFTFLLILSVYLLLEFQKNLSLKYALLAGAILATSALTRYTTILLPFWLLLFWFLFKNKKNTLLGKRVFLIIFIFLLLVSSWIIYHYITFHQLPNNLRDMASLQVDKGAPDFSPKTLKRWVQKAIFFWNPGVGGTRVIEIQKKFPLARLGVEAYRASFFLILGGAVVSFYFRKRKAYLLWGIILYFWIFHIIAPVPSLPRYALPLMPFIILLAFVSLDNIMIRTTQRKII